ncbi:hypothetical protein ES332_A11G249700v1 [Gossypium tomentosum]|uniref:Uncharacterized protein n=1 Tax=Gossypium tomentosum TaxID=34277 RepID=A0A5D2NG91_GOSTO|nr:hypothetical protein ES332_A11G249700v1 [Gossypium tomentosum]
MDHRDQLHTIAANEANNLTHTLVCSLMHHMISGKPYSPHCNTNFIMFCYMMHFQYP